SDDPDRPEVPGEAGLDEICVRECEIARDSPFMAPRVADEEQLPRIVITHRHHCMAADCPLSGRRHRSVAGLLYSSAFEALVDSEPEHERIAGRQAALHLVEVCDQALV